MKIRLTESQLKSMIRDILSEWYEPDINYDEDFIDSANYNPDYNEPDYDDIEYADDEEEYFTTKKAYNSLASKYGKDNVHIIFSSEYSESDSDCYDVGFLVRRGDEWNLAYRDGSLLSNRWYNKVGWDDHSPEDKLCYYNIYSIIGAVPVMLNGKWNLVNLKNGETLSKVWFDSVCPYEGGPVCFVKVELNGEPYLIDRFGDLYDMDEHYIKSIWNK